MSERERECVCVCVCVCLFTLRICCVHVIHKQKKLQSNTVDSSGHMIRGSSNNTMVHCNKYRSGITTAARVCLCVCVCDVYLYMMNFVFTETAVSGEVTLV